MVHVTDLQQHIPDKGIPRSSNRMPVPGALEEWSCTQNGGTSMLMGVEAMVHCTGGQEVAKAELQDSCISCLHENSPQNKEANWLLGAWDPPY